MIRRFTAVLAQPLAAAWLLLCVASCGRSPSGDDARKLLELKGGAILTFAIEETPAGAGLVDAKSLVKELKARLDPADLHNVAVRMAGNDKIEVILPSAGDDGSQEAKRVKRLLKKGSLEICVLANADDDKEAIDDAIKSINHAALKTTRELEESQLEGRPPPGPRTGELAIELKRYDLALAKGAACRVTYRWVELGPHELRQLNLDEDSKADPRRNHAYKEAASSRGMAVQLATPDRKLLNGALFYSRECRSRDLSPEERTAKPFEYFVLCRDPEIVDGKQTPRIDGSFLVEASKESSHEGQPAVFFTFSAKGGKLMGDLTGKNTPSHGERMHKRLLAIVIDGLVVSAPSIDSVVSTWGQIAGPNFTERQVDEMVRSLRWSMLPVTLRPFGESVVDPAKK